MPREIKIFARGFIYSKSEKFELYESLFVKVLYIICDKFLCESLLKLAHLQKIHTLLKYFYPARMAELVDALDSGSSDCKVVEVRVLFRASYQQNIIYLS